MGFAREVPPAEALPAGHDGHDWHLVTRVLPMGFVNSVAIAQHVHRRVISQALYSGTGLATKQHAGDPPKPRQQPGGPPFPGVPGQFR